MALSVLSAACRAANAPAMLTPGRFSVNDRGSFTYAVPIAIPPGTAGMVPSLSLDYDSQTGNGLEGLGWSLQGLPAVGRCPMTLAQDGVHGGVNYDANDRVRMGGERLVLISGTYGADGSQYRTEIEGFSEIIAHGQAGAGPAWFEVHTKAGQEMDFGDTTDSRILAQGKTTARAWAVNKIIDAVGNYLTVTYTDDQANGRAYPVEIDYTGNTRDAELHLLSQTIGNVFTTTETFNPQTGRVATIQAGANNAIANFSYGFDTLGNLNLRADANEALTETYTYDALNRLKTVTRNGSQSWSGDYDAEGDITSKSDVGSYTYSGAGAGPHAVTSVAGTVNGVTNPTFLYDADGNMTSGAGRSYGWTSFNMAGSVVDGSKTLSFTYDSEHQRITQVAPEGTTVYLNDPATGSMSEAFVAGSTTTFRDYVKADGVIVVVRSAQGSSVTLQYVVSDRLGGAAVVTDASGNVLQRLSYDAWGARRNPDGTVPVTPIVGIITRGFTGQEMMDDVGLINFNARLYDPQLGRFASADPSIADAYLSKLLDRYGYVGDNPLSLTDPSGLCFISCTFDAILGVVVAIVLPELLPELESELIVGESIANFAQGSVLWTALNLGVAGGVSGFIATGSLKGALLGSAEALAFFEVGGRLAALRGLTHAEFVADRFVAHGFVGGLFTVAEGGNFGSGFLAAGVGSLAPAPTPGQRLTFDDLAEGTAESAILGGAGSVLGGGKFENGAETGAFGYLFNEAADAVKSRHETEVVLGYERIGDIGGRDYYHTYVEVISPDGQTYFVRAGPSVVGGSGSSAVSGQSSGSSWTNGGLGDLYVSFGEAARNAESGGVTTFLMQVVGFLNEPYAQVVATLNSFGQAVNASHIEYWPLSTNSNAFADQAIQYLGLPRPAPPVWAPGSGTVLPVRH